MSSHIAVDLGATSGRVSLGFLQDDQLHFSEVSRFANTPAPHDGTLSWDLTQLYGNSLSGIGAAVRRRTDHPIVSLGVDSWGVDFSLVRVTDSDHLPARHYRSCGEEGVARVRAQIAASTSYAITGIQQLPINTLYQLSDAAERGDLTSDRTMLLIPDLWVYWLTGSAGAERSIASTTELLDARTGQWSAEIAARSGIPLESLPPLVETGSVAGELAAHKLSLVGATSPISVIRVAEHDTASAVLALPAARSDFGFISCGSWSLVGQELEAPVLTEEARSTGFTNESGAFGSTLFMQNLAGLWMLEQFAREWNIEHDTAVTAVELITQAGAVTPLRHTIDVRHPDFLRPGGIRERIVAHCRSTGSPEPSTPAEFARCILQSLVIAYRRAIEQAQAVSGQPIEVLHLTGGGSRSPLLCQLTADACGRTVLAGPAEGTSMGNILAQMIATGTLGDRDHARAVMRNSVQPLRYEPTVGAAAGWAAAAARFPADTDRAEVTA